MDKSQVIPATVTHFVFLLGVVFLCSKEILFTFVKSRRFSFMESDVELKRGLYCFNSKYAPYILLGFKWVRQSLLSLFILDVIHFLYTRPATWNEPGLMQAKQTTSFVWEYYLVNLPKCEMMLELVSTQCYSADAEANIRDKASQEGCLLFWSCTWGTSSYTV